MTDKVQKIKEWISKTQDGLMDDNGNFENASNEGAFHILSNLDYYIDSLQEGHRPQFKVGDTIRNKICAVHEIVSMDDSAYFFENGGMVRFNDQAQWELAEETENEVWHDASEEPNDMSHCLIFYGCNESAGHYLHYEPVLYNKKEKVFVTSSFPHPTGYKVEQKSFDGGCVAEVYKNRRDRISISDITQWCYLYDLHNISNIGKTENSEKEEPVSEDLKEAANKYIKGNYSPWLYEAMFDCFKAGAKWQEEKDSEEKVLTYKHGFDDCKKQLSEDSKKELPKIWPRENLDDFAYQVAYDLSNDWMRETPTWDDVEAAVKLGAKWQKGKDKEEWMDKALDFFGSNYNSLIDGGVIGVFDDKKKMIEEFVEFMNDENL